MTDILGRLLRGELERVRAELEATVAAAAQDSEFLAEVLPEGGLVRVQAIEELKAQHEAQLAQAHAAYQLAWAETEGAREEAHVLRQTLLVPRRLWVV